MTERQLKRADVELRHVLGQRRLLDAPAQDVELLLELAVVEPGIAAADQDLLDLGPRGVGLLADHRDVDRHLAPAQDGMAEAQDLGLDDGAAALLRAEIGARQEHHADGDAADLRGLAARIAHMVAEEVLRDLDMDARAVAGLAVGIDGAPVPHRLQRIDARHHHVAPAPAVQRHDQADAAGVDLLGGVVAVGGGEARGAGAVGLYEFLPSSAGEVARRPEGSRAPALLLMTPPPASRAPPHAGAWGGMFIASNCLDIAQLPIPSSGAG